MELTASEGDTMNSKHRTVRAALAAILAIVSAVFVVDASAQLSDRMSRFALSPKTGKFTPAPSFKGPSDYVVKLSGDPVAVVRSRAPDKQISESERQAIETTLRAQQEAVRPAIEATG